MKATWAVLLLVLCATATLAADASQKKAKPVEKVVAPQKPTVQSSPKTETAKADSGKPATSSGASSSGRHDLEVGDAICTETEQDPTPPTSNAELQDMFTHPEKLLPKDPKPADDTAEGKALWEAMVTAVSTVCQDVDTAAIANHIYAQLGIDDKAAHFKDKLSALKQPFDVPDLVRRIAAANRPNEYLYDAFLRLSANEAFRTEMAALFANSKPQLCRGVIFAGILDRIGNIAAEDYRVMHHFVERSIALREQNKASYVKGFCTGRNGKGLFIVVKQLSVEIPWTSFLFPQLDEASKLGKDKSLHNVGPSFGVPVNIAEAVVQDNVDGFQSNGAAGVRLIEAGVTDFPQYVARSHGHTGAHSFEYNYDWNPTPKLWNDLYQVWNMAFVIRFKDWPVMWAKLLTPYVADYSAHPERYMYRRGSALLLTLITLVEEVVSKTPANVCTQFSPALRDAFGKANAQNAARFRLQFLKTPSLALMRLTGSEEPQWYWKRFMQAFDREQARSVKKQ